MRWWSGRVGSVATEDSVCKPGLDRVRRQQAEETDGAASGRGCLARWQAVVWCVAVGFSTSSGERRRVEKSNLCFLGMETDKGTEDRAGQSYLFPLVPKGRELLEQQ